MTLFFFEEHDTIFFSLVVSYWQRVYTEWLSIVALSFSVKEMHWLQRHHVQRWTTFFYWCHHILPFKEVACAAKKCIGYLYPTSTLSSLSRKDRMSSIQKWDHTCLYSNREFFLRKNDTIVTDLVWKKKNTVIYLFILC